MFRYNEWMYTQEENQIEKYLFRYDILYALNVSESIITFARKRLNFKESIFLLLFSISTKFYKYAIHSSFTHMLNMGQLRVQTRRCEYYPIFTHTRTCGQGQEIVTRTSLRIFAHENSFRDPALRKAARIDSDCWKEMQSSGILPKQINLALKRSLISFHLFLLNIGPFVEHCYREGPFSVSPTFLQCFLFRARARLNKHCQWNAVGRGPRTSKCWSGAESRFDRSKLDFRSLFLDLRNAVSRNFYVRIIDHFVELSIWRFFSWNSVCFDLFILEGKFLIDYIIILSILLRLNFKGNLELIV